ncbi:MAG TPA: DUF4424 domain-containing protein [Devosia sp.]|nr:DUF4424 domain-containing protein [Devosia sp.]
MRVYATAAFALMLAVPAAGNDTTAQLGAGGLVFVTNEQIKMASEDLYISPTQVRVTYEFENTSEEDQHILVAFPMPDVQGSGDFMVDVPIQNVGFDGNAPIEDPNNLFGFETTFDGVPVEAELHQYVFSNNIDYTKLLKNLGVPLEPFGEATATALEALDEADARNLARLGLVYYSEYDAGSGWQVEIVPIWTLKSTYSWEATFKPGISDVVHTYRPSVGGTVATTFIPNEGDEYAEARYADYVKKYCVEDSLVSTVRKQGKDMDGWTSYPYYENWISYIWSTGNNWSGPIGKFTLTVDKGSTDNLVSFCGENVKKIGPTTFQMTATDWWPPYDRELEILLLKRIEDE